MPITDKLRRRVRKLSLRGHDIDPSAQLHYTARLERTGVAMGPKVRVGGGCVLIGPLAIGRESFLNEGVYMTPDVTLEENVSVGQFVRLITGTHDMGDSHRRAGATIRKPITVGRGAWLGAGAMVMPGVSIGAGAVVAAGSLVTKDVPPNVLVMGSPARVVRDLPA